MVLKLVVTCGKFVKDNAYGRFVIEKRKIIHLQLVQMVRLETTAQVDSRVNPEEGETSMNASATL